MRKKRRGRAMKALLNRVLALMTDNLLKSFDTDRKKWEESINTIAPEDVWVEIYPFVLSVSDDDSGWELADGDPVCNWCMNTFTEEFPRDVEPLAILDRMIQSLGEGLIVTDDQARKYFGNPSFIEGAISPQGHRVK